MRKRREPPTPSGATAAKSERIHRFLEEEVWPTIPKKVIGKKVTKRERKRILGYGPHGV